MKLRQDQKQLLEKYISNVVLYKETYEEIYDHVLTALEGRDGIENLQRRTHQLIDDDFGGYAGIAKLESQRRDMIRADLRSTYLHHVKVNLQNPLIILLLMILGLAYYLAGDVYKEYSVTQITSGLLGAFMPWTFFSAAKHIRAFKTNQLKDPIALAAFGFDAVLPALWYVLFMISSFLIRQCFWNHGFRVAQRITDGINTLLFMMMVFNVYLFFNIYHRKLKPGIS